MTRWTPLAGLTLKLTLVVAVVYVGGIFYERWSRPSLVRDKPASRKIHPDLYVYPPKSYVTDFASARKLIGKPLWVKEGYRWIYEPGNRTLEPIERIVPSDVIRQGKEVRLRFEKEGRPYTLPVGVDGRFFVDEIFYIKDPRELWSHWPDEVWTDIAHHRVRVGMSEHQIVFALGAGNALRASPGSRTRIVDYRLGAEAGIDPQRVTYSDGVAEKIEKLPAEPNP
jgi:hypothetical protein